MKMRRKTKRKNFLKILNELSEAKKFSEIYWEYHWRQWLYAELIAAAKRKERKFSVKVPDDVDLSTTKNYFRTWGFEPIITTNPHNNFYWVRLEW